MTIQGKIKRFIQTIIIVIGTVVVTNAQNDDRPNIIFIMTDDHTKQANECHKDE